MTTTSLEPADFTAMRHAMVASQLRTTAVDDARVVATMASVPREDFVPAAARGIAYRDTAVALGRGRWLNTPMATGRLLTEAEIVPEDRVLLIGAATGYAATLLAALGARVVAVECDGGLALLARTALAATTVEIVEAPLAGGHPAGAPYDVLVIDGAVETLPMALVAQLRVGGRIVTGLAERGVTRLAAGRRTEGGHGVQPFADAECVALPGFAAPAGFRF
jgi:protein-L-isoaspartate(D-aspartate) O-methyltransferase